MESRFSFTSNKVLSDIKPAIGKGNESIIFSSTDIANPPPILAIAAPTFNISLSLVPTIIILWESWATDEPKAPFFRPIPLTNLYLLFLKRDVSQLLQFLRYPVWYQKLQSLL